MDLHKYFCIPGVGTAGSRLPFFALFAIAILIEQEQKLA